jgi:hypothetical protein
MTTNKDTDLREALRRKYADTPQLPADFLQRMHQATEKETKSPIRRWLYPISAIAASLVLLFSLGVALNNRHSGNPNLVAQGDTLKTSPRTETKEVEKNLEKEKNTEAADTVKILKEQIRMPRTPKHYMAKAEPAEVTPEPDPIDATELAERAFAEEKRRLEMELMEQMNGSLQADFMEIANEIRQRGERMTQRVEIAMSTEE